MRTLCCLIIPVIVVSSFAFGQAAGSLGDPDTSVTISISIGWNMVSLPVSTPTGGVLANFPGTAAFQLAPAGGYAQTDRLALRRGYWLHVPGGSGTTEFTLRGGKRLGDTLQLSKGWNLIGALSRPVRVNRIETTPFSSIEGLVGPDSLGTIINDVRKLFPGYAYWIRLSRAATLVMTAD